MQKPKEGTVLAFIWEMVEFYFSKKVSRSAAALAYFLILSFFPALIILNAIIGALHVDVAALVGEAAIIIPDAALNILTEYVGYITDNRSPALLTAGVAAMLICASAAMRTLMNAIDDINGRKTYAGVWQVVASVVFSILFLVAILLSVVVVLTGDWFLSLVEGFLRKHIPSLAGHTLLWDWQWLRFIILFCVILLVVMLLYQATAPRGKPRAPVLSGALLASVALVLFSILFSYFIGLSSRYSLVYGSLASVMILLVWLYFCGTILILGACFNRVWYAWKMRGLFPERKPKEGSHD